MGEDVLAGGASEYVGVDFSEPMLAPAEDRLRRFGDRARLVRGDVLDVDLGEPFDVVLAVGFFDYTPEAHLFVRRMHAACRGTAVASFPRWNWFKGPIRKVRYEVLNNCTIFNYTEHEVRFLFGAAGLARTSVTSRGRTGYLVRADV